MKHGKFSGKFWAWSFGKNMGTGMPARAGDRVGGHGDRWVLRFAYPQLTRAHTVPAVCPAGVLRAPQGCRVPRRGAVCAKKGKRPGKSRTPEGGTWLAPIRRRPPSVGKHRPQRAVYFDRGIAAARRGHNVSPQTKTTACRTAAAVFCFWLLTFSPDVFSASARLQP